MNNEFHIVDLDDTLCRTTHDLQGDHERLKHLMLYEDAVEYLHQEGVRRVLVTAGNMRDQLKKVDHLGISCYFEEILICHNPQDKKLLYEQIAVTSGIPRDEIVVIGDRVDTDIRFGNESGLRTVRMHRADGKYFSMCPKEDSEKPWLTVSTFTEMMMKLHS